ncbi:MAG: hypothetical protein AAFU71_06210 [Cyanobacteria bacterium J06632_22]
MTILYSLGELDFEWDQTKAESNEKKHGVTFKEAPKFSSTRLASLETLQKKTKPDFSCWVFR